MALNNTVNYQTTNHNVLVGKTGNLIENIAPSATAGVPLISQGSSADPSYGTAKVAGGGTGLTSATAYSLLCGGTTTTGNFQSVASVGTSGQFLMSNGAGALPSFTTVAPGTGIGTVGNVTSGSVAFDGTAGTLLTSTLAGFTLTVADNDAGNGGDFLIQSGFASEGGSGGNITLNANTGSFTGDGGNVILIGGSADTDGAGGSLTFTGGIGVNTGNTGGGIFLTTGDGLSQPSGEIQLLGGTSSGSNIAGGDVTIANGLGTGVGATGKIYIKGNACGSVAATTATHARVNRLILNGIHRTLTSGAAGTIATLSLASDSMSGGSIDYTVEASDGTDFLVASGQVAFAATNKAGTITGTTSILGTEAKNTTTGTITNVWTVTGSGLIQLECTVVGITPTTLRVTYSVFCNSQQAISVP